MKIDAVDHSHNCVLRLEWIVWDCCDSLLEASATESWRGKGTCANEFCTGMLQVNYTTIGELSARICPQKVTNF